MGLFGKSKEEIENEKKHALLEQERQQKKELSDSLQKKEEEISKLDGVIGKAEGELFDDKNLYKLTLESDTYTFYAATYGRSFNTPIEKLEELLMTGPIVLNKDSYTCELVKETLPFEMDTRLVGEGILKANPIKLCFRNIETGHELFFYVDNTPKNIAPAADFFRELGVKNYYNVLDLPKEIYSLKVLQGNAFLCSNADYLVFRNKGVLTFIRAIGFSQVPSIRIAEIGLDEILYYKSEGSVRYEQLISGSGGAENSYGGAVIGGLLFGAAGAIIGSRANETKTEITSKTVTHDTRILMLSIKRNSVVYTISLDLNAEQVLDWIIPEKQYEYVIQKRREMYEKNPMT